MFAAGPMKVRVVREYEESGLADWLKEAAAGCDRSVAAICAEAGLTTQFWYEVLKDRKPLRLATLERLENALGCCYVADWRSRERDQDMGDV
jgi:hypothetical protein